MNYCGLRNDTISCVLEANNMWLMSKEFECARPRPFLDDQLCWREKSMPASVSNLWGLDPFQILGWIRFPKYRYGFETRGATFTTISNRSPYNMVFCSTKFKILTHYTFQYVPYFELVKAKWVQFLKLNLINRFKL